MKKILSLLLTAALVLSLFTVCAADEITSDVTWNDGETYGGMSISGTTVITVNGTVNIDSTISISGNVTITGGGTLKAAASGTTLISVAENATLTLADITIDGNNSAAAMAVYGGKVFIKDGASISNCKKTSRGSALDISGGEVTMDGGRIAGCTTEEYGGAVYLSNGASFTLNNGTIENNKTTDDSYSSYGGGAIYVRDALLTINGGTIQNNSSNKGGAIYNSSYGTTVINGGTITNNKAVGDNAHGAAIFHSYRTTSHSEALLQIGGNANIDAKTNDIYLMNNNSTDKYIEITSSLKNELLLTVDNAAEGRLIAKAADGFTLTNNDMAKISVSNSEYALSLENNEIKLSKTTGGETKKHQVFLGYEGNGDGVTNVPEGQMQEISEGEKATFTVASEVPSRNDYTFLGWASAPDASAAEYTAGAQIETAENVVLYAVWHQTTEPQKDNEFTTPLSITGWTYGDEPNAPAAEAKYGTVKFTYSTEENGTYTADVPADAGTYYVKAEVFETPAYKGLSATAQFTIAQKTIDKTIPLTAPVKNAKAQKTIETDEYTATVTWTPDVTENFDYGTAYKAVIEITPKPNYTLSGIEENSYVLSKATTVTNAADSGSVTAEYPATGSKNTGSISGSGTLGFAVTFDTNGGGRNFTQSAARNTAVKEPAAPVKSGYEFTGWYTDKELKNKYDFSEKVTKSFTLYAGWAEVTEDNSVNQIILTINEKDAIVFGTTKTNDVAPKIVNDRTMLPARFVAENLGADVSWDGENQVVTITGKNLKTDDDVTIVITIGSDTALVNGEEIKLDSPAFIENDRTYTPIRFISENLGASVSWIESEMKVVITK